jgi:hypothetical protein
MLLAYSPSANRTRVELWTVKPVPRMWVRTLRTLFKSSTKSEKMERNWHQSELLLFNRSCYSETAL